MASVTRYFIAFSSKLLVNIIEKKNNEMKNHQVHSFLVKKESSPPFSAPFFLFYFFKSFLLVFTSYFFVIFSSSFFTSVFTNPFISSLSVPEERHLSTCLLNLARLFMQSTYLLHIGHKNSLTSFIYWSIIALLFPYSSPA